MINSFRDMLFNFWNSPKSMDLLTKVILIIPVFCLIVFLFPWFFSQPSFYLKYLIVDLSENDTPHITNDELKKLVVRELNGTAITSDLSPIYKSVVSHPWVKEATVRRIWPNKILVSLIEHNIVGVWSDGRFVTDVGKLLYFEKLQSESIENEKKCLLVQLDGPPDTGKIVLDRASMISKKASLIGLQLIGIQLTTQYDWKVFFSNGMKMELGGDSIKTPIDERLDNFFNSVGWFSKKIKKDLVSVDLRYAQGFAFEERAKSNIRTIRPNKKKDDLKSCIENHDPEEVIL